MTDDGRKATGLAVGEKGQPAFGEAALFGLCPQCGARTLFAGWIAFADRCRAWTRARQRAGEAGR